MGIDTVPEDDGPTGEMTAQLGKKIPDQWSVDGHMRMKAEEQPHAVTSWGDDQGDDGRNFLVSSSSLQENRCLAPGRPCATQQRGHQESAFINKDPMGLQARGFFLIRTQSTLTQVCMRFSSRSTDRRSGLWGDHPRERINKEM